MESEDRPYQRAYALARRRRNLGVCASVAIIGVGLLGAKALLATNGPWAPACALVVLLGACGLFVSLGLTRICPRCGKAFRRTLIDHETGGLQCDQCATWLIAAKR